MKKNQMFITGAAILAAAGLALGAASIASADQGSGSRSTTAPGYSNDQGGTMRQGGASNGNTDPTKPMRSDEKLLTGDTLAKVTAAARAKEPGATIQRVETDSDGVYEAHMVRSDGTHVTVKVNASFEVTSVDVGGPGGHGMGGPGGQGMGDHDGDGPQGGSTGPSTGEATPSA